MTGRYNSQAVAAARPVAVRLGLTQVNVVRGASGWVAVAWSPNRDGPFTLTAWGDLARAIDQARGYAALNPLRLLDVDGFDDPGGDGGLIHVVRSADGLEVHHQARGGSWGYLRHFALADEKRAVGFALSACDDYASRLGRLELAGDVANDKGAG